MNREELVAKIVSKVASFFKEGDFINLGIGIPTKVANFIPKGLSVILQSENGMLKMGGMPRGGEEDERVKNASGEFSSILEGGMFYDSAFSFGLIRGGHIDITVLGGLEVDEGANLANWIIPNKFVPGMGGAMDLVNGAKMVIVAMEHCTKDGGAKILKRCTLPLTGRKCVDKIVTELAVFDFIGGKLTLTQLQEGVSLDEVKSKTEASFEVKLG